MPQTRHIGVNQLARETGYAQTWVTQMLQRGLSVEQIRERAKARGGGKKAVQAATDMGKPRAPRPEGKRGGQKPGADTGHAMIAANREKATRGHTGETMLDASLRKEIAIADQRELELAIRRGEMVPRHMMREWFGEVFLGVRDIMLRIFPENKDRFAVETDPAKIEAWGQAEIERALDLMAAMSRKLALDADEPKAA